MSKQLLSLMMTISFRFQVYKLVRDLHRIGIIHGDLEPRNVARTREGLFGEQEAHLPGEKGKWPLHSLDCLLIMLHHLKNRGVMNCNYCETTCGNDSLVLLQ